MTDAASPASTGPAGSHLEAKVGAHYLLAMLLGSEARGLPGVRLSEVKLQRGAEGHPLDDVIAVGFTRTAEQAVLEAQVKRAVAFSPADAVFEKICGQIAEAAKIKGFFDTRIELAIATSQSSRKIDGPYQDVITWARQIGDAKTFCDRLTRPGSASDDMRTFVATFRKHLAAADVNADDETVWRLLGRLKILVFDYTATGSVSEALALDQCARALHPDEVGRASELWAALIQITLAVAEAGGDRTREQLTVELKERGFRLLGDLRNETALNALAEASSHALADINDRVFGVTLLRHKLLAAVHVALDQGRFVEIRGSGGVGKSAMLKHLALQQAAAGPIIVLSPGRTIPRGWTAMRSVIGFHGSCREFLVDVAAGGTATIFLDGLEHFAQDERPTACDLIREAVGVPGVTIVATARTDFGRDEPHWLPQQALDQLVRGPTVQLDELDATELDELGRAAPHLAQFLTDGHPARDITRNLFRLSRLALRPTGESPRSEVDMAAQWWSTADGERDDLRRERARLLRELALQLLAGTERLDVSSGSPGVIEALVASGTLIDLGQDHVAFSHDVLREWAVASLLREDSGLLSRIDLSKPASATFSRAVELLARVYIEYEETTVAWWALLERVSAEAAHGSWRRAALLALPRSEVASKVLNKAASGLLANDAALLRELIRTLMAVDSDAPAALFAAMGIDSSLLPESMRVPKGPSWSRLAFWLYRNSESLPVAALRDVIAFNTVWSVALLGHDPLTPYLVAKAYEWLQNLDTPKEGRPPLGEALSHDERDRLRSALLSYFKGFARRQPALAAEYLRGLIGRREGNREASQAVLHSGSLSEAAPEAMAELTRDVLIKSEERGRYGQDSIGDRRAFRFVDSQFLPQSPARGPFRALMNAAPEVGLALVRRLIDHVIGSAAPQGKPHTIMLNFDDGERTYIWPETYGFSRQSNYYALTCALMAVESWAHAQVEAGRGAKEIVDVIAPDGAYCAFLLVAVDVVITRGDLTAAVPLAGSPELLAMDHMRKGHDSFKFDIPDIFGLKALQKEPGRGKLTAEHLKGLRSRSWSLIDHFGYYAFQAPILRDQLRSQLEAAAVRLGPVEPGMRFNDPALMAAHALNLLDPANYHAVEGAPAGAMMFKMPPEMETHFADRRTVTEQRAHDLEVQMQVGSAADDASKSSPALAKAAADWVKRTLITRDGQDGDNDTSENDYSFEHDRLVEHAIAAAALVIVRDGDEDLRREHGEWAREHFARVLLSPDKKLHRSGDGMRYNPPALSFAGTIYLYQQEGREADRRILLEAASRYLPGIAHGFVAACAELLAADERMPKALLRCVMANYFYEYGRWDEDDEAKVARCGRRAARASAVVEAELAWLEGRGPEIAWPSLPNRRPALQSGVTLRDDADQAVIEQIFDDTSLEPDENFDYGAAALWVEGLRRLASRRSEAWHLEFAQAYAAWTLAANGDGFGRRSRLSEIPTEWNSTYFDLLGLSVELMQPADVDDLVLGPLGRIPDKVALTIIPEYLHALDVKFFEMQTVSAHEAVRIRTAVAQLVESSHAWMRQLRSFSTSMDHEPGGAMAALFFNHHRYLQPPRTYLVEHCLEKLDPFVPLLSGLIQRSPNFYVALLVLNALEVRPRAELLTLLLDAAEAWVTNFPGHVEFWISNGVGRRVCALFGAINALDPALLSAGSGLRTRVDGVLAALVTSGVAEATLLERELAHAT